MYSKKNEPENGSGLGWKLRYFLFLCICTVFVIAVVILVNKITSSFTGLRDNLTDALEGEEGKVTTVSEASLKKVLEISELSTADYTYNAVAKAYKADGTTIRYYVAYEGRVKAGIDFSKIMIEIDTEAKVISVTIPQAAITEKTVNPGTLEYIFKDKKSETENVHQEAYELCEKDLAERSSKEEALLKLARDNSVAFVKALIAPWVAQIDKEYIIEVQ